MSDPQGFAMDEDEPLNNFDIWSSGFSAVHVSVSTKQGTEGAFIEASVKNAQNSVLEPGIGRFDLLQSMEEPEKFLLLEVYNNPEGPAAHKETEHYAKWRDEVADMMAEPRSAIKYRPIFPYPDFWKTDGKAAEATAADTNGFVAILVDVQVKPTFDESRFIGYTLYNCEQSLIEEEGVMRFDLLQNIEDPRNFVLLEVYKDEAAAKSHKQTPHYEVWKEEVQILMDRPRTSKKFKTLFPLSKFFEWPEDFSAMAIDTDLLDKWDQEEQSFVTTAESERKRYS